MMHDQSVCGPMPAKRKDHKKKETKKSSTFLVRSDGPNDEKQMLTAKEVKDKYMLNMADMAVFEGIRTNKPVDLEDPVFKLNKHLMFGAWWPRNKICLPTNVHFPFEKDESTTLKVTKDMGLIRPVSKDGLKALMMAFDEHGGVYDASHPVHTRHVRVVLVCGQHKLIIHPYCSLDRMSEFQVFLSVVGLGSAIHREQQGGM
jgi:hypothetical protein